MAEGEQVQKSVKEIALWICNAVASESEIEVSSLKSSIHGREEYSHGLYFLYNAQKEVVYVGMTHAKKQSLFRRINGNGSGAHKNKNWFSNVCYVKFYPFDGYSKEQLKLAERLAIREMEPMYNDETMTIENVSQFTWS